MAVVNTGGGGLSVAQVAAPWNTATFTKPDVTVAGSSGAWTTANSPITLFTITGDVMLRLRAVVTTGLTSTSGTGTLGIQAPGLGGGSAVNPINSGLSVNGTAFATGATWGASDTAANTALSNNGAFSFQHGGVLQLVIGTNNMTAGGMTIYCDWIALSAGATVVAATP